MNLRTGLLATCLALLLLCAGCKENPTEPTDSASSIIGTVLRADDNAPVQGATIMDLGTNGATAFSDSLGNFTLPVGTLTSTYSTTLIIEANGYISDTTDIEVEPEKDQTITIRLKQYIINPVTPGATGQAASIELVLQTDKSLSVRSAGGVEKALLTFGITDSLGYPLTLQRAVMVRFSIIGGSIGGEFLLPDSIMTNSSGLASTVVSAGTKSRVMQVVASTVVAGETIISPPAQFTISGGLPDSVRSTIWASSQNYPGISGTASLLGQISAMLVDKYGNPVQVGNLAYFETTGGSIDAIGMTDATGLASVNIYGGGIPPVAGIDTIKVTVNKQDGIFTKYLDVTFSGTPIITATNVPNDSINIFDGTGQTLDLRICDANGNPLAAGNKISVIPGGLVGDQVKISGDVNAVTPDTRNPALTSYQIRVDDKEADGGSSGPFTLQIMVSGPNGNASKFIYGTLQPPQAIIAPRESAKLPAQIAFVSVSTADIYVAGTGSVENSVITYEVKDSLGMLIGKNPRAFAQFSTVFQPNTWTNVGTAPILINTSDSTDDNARLRVTVRSGTQAGVVQVYSQIDLGNGMYVTSQPVKISVHAGFADQNHFTIAAPRYNFPGLEKAFWMLDITAQVADRYSNPVLQGTAVYFNTTHGAVGTGTSLKDPDGVTDKDGFVLQTLWSGNPYPEGSNVLPGAPPGFSWVYGRTEGENGTWVRDSILVLWTGNVHPSSLNVTGPETFDIPNGGSAGPWSFTVVDKYGHPMSEVTAINVAGAGLAIYGNVNKTMLDTPPSFTPPNTYTAPSGPGITEYTFIARDADPKNVSDPPTLSLLTITIIHPVYGTYEIVIASGTVE
ncbi:MAG: hypothetical protein JXA06_07440 [Bacteroidetes bacterium]|nr:hypothetical protein [Bacteroidota bacterium]